MNQGKETVIQFGEGGFLRGFVDYFFQKLRDQGLFEGSVVVVQPIERGMCASVPLPESLKKPNLWKAACIILLCLILVPIIVPIFMAVILVLVSILIGILGITVGIVAASIVLPLSGILLIGYGIWRLFLLPGVGLTLGGVGCILLAVGILLFILTVWIIKVLLPLCLRAIISVIRFPLRKAGVVK